LDENVSNLLLEVNQYAQSFMQKTNGMEIPPQVMQMMTPVAQGEEVTIDPQILTDAEATLQAPQDVLNTPQGEETVQQVTDPAEQVIAQTVTEQGTKNLTQTNEEDDASMVQNQQTTADNNTEQKESLSSDSDANDFTQSQNQQFNMNQTSAAESQNAQATTANQFAQQVQTAQTAQTVSYASNISYAQEVLDQVTEFVSTNVTADTSSIEMSLTPETLGKLYIKVAQVEGQITASITATTETARQALASQVYTLKEALNLQGIKVEAVEVSVATHEFERNLEENADSRQQEQMGEEQEKVSGGRRRSLNLSENGELPEDLTEAEELAATIMKDNGNSVDLTA
jgi:flagellar hook-length control protein FliK